MLIKKGLILFWHLLIKPNRIEKIQDTTDFLKKCRYHQRDIEIMFEAGVFNFKRGSVVLHRDAMGQLNGDKIEFHLTGGLDRPVVSKV